MITSGEGREFIKGWEKLRLNPYMDSAGKLTVGWGHVLLPGEHRGERTVEECEALFEGDIAKVDKALDEKMLVEVPQPCYDAIVAFTFNVGINALLASTLFRKVNEGRLVDALQEFPRWRYARNRDTGTMEEVRGLVRRRAAEVAVFEFADYTGRP